MNVDKIDILCNQVIDIALVSKEAVDTINSAPLSIYPSKFIKRINSVVNYVYNLFIDSNNDKYNEDDINDLMVNLMYTLTYYKNSYNSGTYGYRIMNSLFDIVKDTFVELNK